MVKAGRRITGGVSASWTPASLSSLVGWWRADSLNALSDGAGVSSWPDLSTNANTLTQGTGARQPIYHNGSSTHAIGGQPVVTFVAANTNWLQKASPTGIPATAPMWMLIVLRKLVTTSNYECMLNYGAGSGSGGLFVGFNSSSAHNYQSIVGSWAYAGPSVALGVATASLYQLSAAKVPSQSNLLRGNYPTGTAQSTGAITAPTQLTLGYYATTGVNPTDADIAEVIYGGALMSNLDCYNLCGYLLQRYGLVCGNFYAAPSALAIGAGNYDGTGNIIEFDHQFNNSTVYGHKWWGAYVPSAAHENPSVVYSDDFATFTAPQTNPVVAPLSSGTNSDPHLRNQPDGNSYIYYSTQGATPSSGNGSWYVVSSDPRTVAWSAPVRHVSDTSYNYETVAVYDGSKYHLFGATPTPSQGIVHFNDLTSGPTGPWNARTFCNYSLPGGRILGIAGEFDVILSATGKHFLMVLIDNDPTQANLWSLWSPVTDGVNWTVKPAPLMCSSYGWESGISLYRPSIQYDSTAFSGAGGYQLVYSAASGKFGFTTVPRAVLEP